jgi:hypothetical protein
MSRSRNSNFVTFAAALVAVAATASVGVPAFAQQIAPEVVKQKIEQAYPVQVLKVEAAEFGGRSALAVRVMNKASARNGDFAVTTLLVDPATGELLPAFRHQVSGYTVPDAVLGDPREVNVPPKGSTWR